MINNCYQIVRIFWIVAITTFGVSFSCQAADGWKVKEESHQPPTELAESQSKLLDPKAIVIFDGEGNEVIKLWFRSSIPYQATEEQVKNGLTYREIPSGTFIAAIQFAKPFVDYRKQTIPAATYTLRFLVQPDVGDHMGTSPHPEFLVLSPVDKDTNAETIETKDLIKLSSATTGGDHPGVMLLFPNNDKTASLKVIDKNDNIKILTTSRRLESDGQKTNLGFAITIHGSSKSR